MRSIVVLSSLLVGSTSFAAPQYNAAEVAAKLGDAALKGGRAFAIVQSLTDKVGARLPGSPAADRAVEWAMKEMRALGLKNVRKEPVKVKRWVRGAESVEILPARPVAAVALGGSVATPPGGITGEVIEVASFDELKAAG